jgi:tRNA(fMet)-specific endonuclease VapC
MELFILDTNICIYAMKRHETALKHLLSCTPGQIHVSVVTESELRFGASKSKAPTRTLAALECFLAPLNVLDFSSRDAITYAGVRAQLERKGTPIGPLDTLIAAHALSREMTLVTNNISEFKRVSDLKTSNWTEA